MAYCTTSFIRTLTNLDSADVGDPKLRDIRDDVATPQLNDDLQVSVDHENLEDINEEKENKVNGSNKTFYLSGLHRNDWHLGDLNNDGTIDSNDVEGYYIDSNDDRQTINVTSVDDAEIGKIKMEQSGGSALPDSVSRDEVFLTYKRVPVDVTGPHALVKTACAQLTAAYAFTRIDVKKLKNYSIGNVTIRNQSDGFAIMYDQYKDTLRKIIDRAVIETKENEESVDGAL